MVDSTHFSSMHLQFDCIANERYNGTAFVKRVIHWVFVTCTDDASFAAAVVNKDDGSFHVDWHLDGTYIVNTLKFHFFEESGNFVASNFLDMHDLLKTLADGNTHEMHARNHRVDNKIEVVLDTTSTSSDASKQALETFETWKAAGRIHASALFGTTKANDMFKRVAESIYNSLTKSTDNDGQSLYTIDPATGGGQFIYPLTTHAMQDQYILTLMLDQAMPPPPKLLERYTNSGLLMYCLIDTLHFQGLTVEDALGHLSKHKLAQFAVAFCQTIQRSNRECRYMPDTISVPTGDGRANILRGTEFFKRPFCEPFLKDALWVDDCEGLGGAIKDMITALLYLYQCRDHPDPAGRRQALFPAHLFQAGLTEEDKERLLELALRLGEMVHMGELRCKMIIMSCGAMYVGAKEGKEIGGHVTVSLQYRPGGFRLEYEEANQPHDEASQQAPPHPPNEGPFDIILEGTNCTQFDMRDGNVAVQLTNGLATVNLSSVANALTEMMLFRLNSSPKPRFGIHFSTMNRLKTYNTVFIQGEHLLATVLPSSKEMYGVAATDISNYAIKRELKIGFHALGPQELEWLLHFCASRSREIHSPIVTHETLDGYLRTHWQPISMPRESVGRRDHPHLDCFVSQPCSVDPTTCARELEKAQEGAVRFNTMRPTPDEPNRPWCSMRVWVSMGSLMTCVTVFTDDTTHLEKMLKESIEYSLTGYTHHPEEHGFDEDDTTPHTPLQFPRVPLFDEPCSDRN